MADRDYYSDRERVRDYDDSRGFGRDRDRDRQMDTGWSEGNSERDRGPISRGADEVRSWFGDDEARRRREMDEYRERADNPGRYRYEEQEHSARTPDRTWSGGSDWRRDPDWVRQPGSRTQFDRGTGAWQGSSYRDAGIARDYGASSTGIRSGYAGSSWSNYTGRTSGYSAGFRPGSFAGRGPRNYRRSDERIREEVNERLTDDPRVDASDIEVEVRDGEVILRGRVDERRDKRTAEEVVENLPGVKDVRNELRVERGGWFGGGDRDRNDRNREEGSLGHTGNPQQRDDVTSLNLSGAASQTSSGNVSQSQPARERDKTDKK
jgi:hypothetical protein